MEDFYLPLYRQYLLCRSDGGLSKYFMSMQVRETFASSTDSCPSVCARSTARFVSINPNKRRGNTKFRYEIVLTTPMFTVHIPEKKR